ncbi:MAG: prepilin peptidase [Legionellales bacterium]|nr:prepilin peptidase [Legionellales bacterium]
MGLEFIEILQSHPFIFLLTVGIFSLLVGSFLNVVIHRLPLMLKRDWLKQCEEFLDELNQQPRTEPLNDTLQPYNLIVPASHCPHCHKAIRLIDNIPIVSFLFLRGKSACCKQPIALRYPLVELLTVIISLIVAWQFGATLACIFAIFFTWTLICLVFIDAEHQLLPDNITLVMLWLGLLLNIYGIFTDITSAVLGAILGYVSLWLVTWLFKLITGKIGMGHGDFKLLAMLGAWLGWQLLPFIILCSAFLGAVIGLSLIALRINKAHQPIPFGPYLALAGWVALLWGPAITQFYLQLYQF